jgi:hypothetical protein
MTDYPNSGLVERPQTDHAELSPDPQVNTVSKNGSIRQVYNFAMAGGLMDIYFPSGFNSNRSACRNMLGDSDKNSESIEIVVGTGGFSKPKMFALSVESYRRRGIGTTPGCTGNCDPNVIPGWATPFTPPTTN